MRFQIIATSILAATLLSGCASDDGVTTNFITPGEWQVGGNTDHILVWAHNGGSSTVEFDWSLTGPGGAALPESWQISFGTPSATLEKDGSKVQGSRGFEYTDWARTLITLTIPADEPAGAHDVELHAGDAMAKGTLNIAANRTTVSGPGSEVTAAYEGRFTDSGELFDQGSFPTTLGSGQTVPGFDYGLMGLAKGEKAEIVIPAAYGYGYDIPAGNRLAKFSGQSLTFSVQITQLTP